MTGDMGVQLTYEFVAITLALAALAGAWGLFKDSQTDRK